MPCRDVAKRTVTCLTRRVVDHADIHHDIDENGILSDERTQKSALAVKPLRQGLPGLDDDIVQFRSLGQLVPAVIRRQENEPEIVYLVIELSRLERGCVFDGVLEPPITLLVSSAEMP